jgi:nucleoside-diphosphate-sugar epimerase
MLVLLTGGNGYVGINILHHIQENTDWDIVCLIHKNECNIPNNIEKIYNLDIPVKYDVIIHAGGNPSSVSCIKSPCSAFNDNIETTFNLLEYARANECKKLIFLSSCEVYGKAMSNSSESDMLFSYNMYGASKVACEHMLSAYYYSYGISSYSIRLINTYGPYCQPERFPSIIKNKFETEDVPHFILHNKTTKRWLDIKIMAERIVFLIKNMNEPACDVFNFVGDEDITLDELIKKMSNGKSFTFEYNDVNIKGYTSSADANGDKFRNFQIKYV